VPQARTPIPQNDNPHIVSATILRARSDRKSIGNDRRRFNPPAPHHTTTARPPHPISIPSGVLDRRNRIAYPPGVKTKSPVRRCAVATLTLTITTAYCLAFFVRPPTTWPGPIRDTINTISKPALALTKSILESCGVESATFAPFGGLYIFMIAGLIPWATMALLRRGRPNDLGCRLPNQYGWRLMCVTYILSLPFLIWMIQSAGFASPYLSQLKRAGGIAFCLYYTLNMLTEHFLLQGVVLAALRDDRRWPPPESLAPIDTASVAAKKLQWLGLAQPTNGANGLRIVERWLGMPRGCVFAILGSGLMFALIHVGKNPRELLLSLPGGIALAILSYRTNTWLTAFVLHLATAGTAFALVLLSR